MRATSIEAWRSLQETLSAARWRVYEAIRRNPECTAAELERLTSNRHLNKRTNELELMGLVVSGPARPCKVTGHSAITWSATERLEPLSLPKKQESITAITERRVLKLVKQHQYAEAKRALSELEGVQP